MENPEARTPRQYAMGWISLLAERVTGRCAECGIGRLEPTITGPIACKVCGRWRWRTTEPFRAAAAYMRALFR